MSIVKLLFEELLRSLPPSIRRRLFPVILVVLLEIATYFFFAYFYFPSHGKETFRTVVTHFGWQVVSLFELSVVSGIILLLSAKNLAARKGKSLVILMRIGAFVVFFAPLGFYLMYHPHLMEEERVDIFYLDYPDHLKEFDKDMLMKLLTYCGPRIRTSFNWVDWSVWSVHSDFERLSSIEKLDYLAQTYTEKNPTLAYLQNPIGITSLQLEGNLFSIISTIPGIKLSVISVADWEMKFAPPSVYEYILNMILLTTIQYRLNDMGGKISEHGFDDYSQAYFDKVMEKSDLRAIICSGHFRNEDKEIIRKTLGKESLKSYQNVLSLNWLQDEGLQQRVQFDPECIR